MYPCGNCRAVAVGPDGRCAACGTYQQQLNPAPTPGPGYPAAPPVSMPAAGAMPHGGVDLRRGMSTTLTVLLGVTVATLILAFIARAQQYGIYSDILDGDLPSQDDADSADSFYALALIISSLVMLAVAIVWPIWFRRLRLNAEAFAPGQHRFGPGWAAGAWFTPVVSLWFPKQIANDIWRASSPQGPHQVRRGLLNGWWVCWLAGGLLFSSSLQQWTRARNRAESSGLFGSRSAIEDMKTALGMNLFAYVVTIAAAILALLVVRQITAMQEQRAALSPAGPPGQMPPSPYGAPTPNPYGGGAPGNPYGAPAVPEWWRRPADAPGRPAGPARPAVRPARRVGTALRAGLARRPVSLDRDFSEWAGRERAGGRRGADRRGERGAGRDETAFRPSTDACTPGCSDTSAPWSVTPTRRTSPPSPGSR